MLQQMVPPCSRRVVASSSCRYSLWNWNPDNDWHCNTDVYFEIPHFLKVLVLHESGSAREVTWHVCSYKYFKAWHSSILFKFRGLLFVRQYGIVSIGIWTFLCHSLEWPIECTSREAYISSENRKTAHPPARPLEEFLFAKAILM